MLFFYQILKKKYLWYLLLFVMSQIQRQNSVKTEMQTKGKYGMRNAAANDTNLNKTEIWLQETVVN